MDSYESEAHQQYVRRFLDGRFENSAFCVLAPNGQDWLTRASRGPEMVLGRSATERLRQFALQYPTKADVADAIVQDFHTFRQALNVASADQRVLVLIHAPKDKEQELRESFKAVANNSKIIGRFHIDFDSSDSWKKPLQGANAEHGIMLIRPGEFGIKGEIMQHLPLTSAAGKIVEAMLKANRTFATTTEKKVYSSHVRKGESQGIYFEGAVPYGEDRDGDGEIDHRGGGRRRR